MYTLKRKHRDARGSGSLFLILRGTYKAAPHDMIYKMFFSLHMRSHFLTIVGIFC